MCISLCFQSVFSMCPPILVNNMHHFDLVPLLKLCHFVYVDYPCFSYENVTPHFAALNLHLLLVSNSLFCWIIFILAVHDISEFCIICKSGKAITTGSNHNLKSEWRLYSPPALIIVSNNDVEIYKLSIWLVHVLFAYLVILHDKLDHNMFFGTGPWLLPCISKKTLMSFDMCLVLNSNRCTTWTDLNFGCIPIGAHKIVGIVFLFSKGSFSNV